MNQVFGDEHTSNPPILSQVLSSQTFTFPETENADESTRLTPQSELMPTPSVSPNNGDERSEVGSNFNCVRGLPIQNLLHDRGALDALLCLVCSHNVRCALYSMNVHIRIHIHISM